MCGWGLLLLHATAAAAERQQQEEQCPPPHLRINCPAAPGQPGGRAGCLQRGCCYNSSTPSTPRHRVDWCSHYAKTCGMFKTEATCPTRCTWAAGRCTAPSPPAPPPPSPIVWRAGSDAGEEVQVHANGAVTASLGPDAPWIGASTPFACVSGASARLELKVSVGSPVNGSHPRLGAFHGYEQSILAPAALRGGVLSARYYPEAAARSAAFEFTVRLASAVKPGAGHGPCYGQPIVSYPFGGKVLQNASWLTFRGEMARHAYGSSTATNTGAGTSPLVLAGQAGATVLVAPSDEFLTTGVSLQSGVLSVGPGLNLVALPAGYSYSVFAVLSRQGGVTRTVLDWGRALQTKYGTLNARLPANPLNEQLSYTTALGEYYDFLDWHNVSEFREELPERALLGVAAYFRENHLPIKLFVLDICNPPRYHCHLGCIRLKMPPVSLLLTGWVHNSPNGAPERHCMFDWEPAGPEARAGVELFPHGLDWLANETGAGMMPCECSTVAITSFKAA